MKEKNRDVKRLFKLLKYIPLLLLALVLLASLKFYDQITIENIVKFTPKNKPLAILIILGLSLVKSLSLVLPTALIYGASGKIFPLGLALLVNFLGLIIIVSVPYFLGSHYGENLIKTIYDKYPRTRKLDEFKASSEWFFVIASRVVKVLPGDLVSMLLGGMKISFPTYLACSLLVRTPPMVSNTFIGSSLVTKSYKGALISTSLTLIISLVSSLIFIKNKKPR